MFAISIDPSNPRRLSDAAQVVSALNNQQKVVAYTRLPPGTSPTSPCTSSSTATAACCANGTQGPNVLRRICFRVNYSLPSHYAVFPVCLPEHANTCLTQCAQSELRFSLRYGAVFGQLTHQPLDGKQHANTNGTTNSDSACGCCKNKTGVAEARDALCVLAAQTLEALNIVCSLCVALCACASTFSCLWFGSCVCSRSYLHTVSRVFAGPSIFRGDHKR